MNIWWLVAMAIGLIISILAGAWKVGQVLERMSQHYPPPGQWEVTTKE